MVFEREAFDSQADPCNFMALVTGGWNLPIRRAACGGPERKPEGPERDTEMATDCVIILVC